MAEVSYVARNAEEVFRRVATAARRAGTPLPTVVAVTKAGTDDEVLALLRTGLVTDVGENRVQLFRARQTLISLADLHPRFHLIGSLQTNKVRLAVGHCDLLQSLDSDRLAAEVERQAAKNGIVQDCLVEVNSGREAAKGGVMPEETSDFLARLAAYPHIRVRGLMTMAPRTAAPEEARPYFRATRTLFERLCAAGYLGEMPVLSMGMSDTFEEAIEEGASMVRIGRAFFRQA